MKKILFVAALFILASTAKAQLNTIITDAKTYTDANVNSNTTRQITPEKLNTSLNKIILALFYIDTAGRYVIPGAGVPNSTGTAWGTSSTGTNNYVTRWTGTNSLGIGVLYDNGTNVGVNVTSPAAKLDLLSGAATVGLNVAGTPLSTLGSGNGAAAADIIDVVGTTGQATSGTGASTMGGTGSKVSIIAGAGGLLSGASSGAGARGGIGGAIVVTAGTGGATSASGGNGKGGTGGAITATAGLGGSSNINNGGDGGVANLNGGTGGVSTASSRVSGNGGVTNIAGGVGGANSTATSTSGNGGSININAGPAGIATGGASTGVNGDINIGVVTTKNITYGNNTDLTNHIINGGGLSIGKSTAADASAILDMVTITKGLLIPRMTSAQKTAISSPATGLMIFQTDGTSGFYYYTGIAWTAIGSGTGTVTSVAALTLGTTGTDLSSSVANSTTTPVITLNVPTASASNRGALSSADWSSFNNKVSSQWTTTGSDIYYNTGSVAIGATSAAASAKLDITSTTKGMLIPRMTTTQMSAISSPATGLLIYNTSTSSFWYHVGSWAEVGWQFQPGGGNGMTVTGTSRVDLGGTLFQTYTIDGIGSYNHDLTSYSTGLLTDVVSGLTIIGDTHSNQNNTRLIVDDNNERVSITGSNPVFQLPQYEVGHLVDIHPTRGDMVMVIDADTPAYGNIVVGGGSKYTPVVWDGTDWICR